METTSEIEYLMRKILRLKGISKVILTMRSLAPHKKRWRVRVTGEREAVDTFNERPEKALVEMRSKLTNKTFIV
jgi:hypothetical protein